MRIFMSVLAVAVVALVGLGIQALSYSYFRSEELRLAEGRLSLYQSTVRAELERFSHLTYVLARDPIVRDSASGGATNTLDQRLRNFASQAGLDAIYLMQPDGLTISASNAGEPSSFLGRNYSFRPYFQSALTGEQGRFYGIGATTGLPGYFIADAVQGPRGQLLGVIALKIDLSKLQDSWRASGEDVLLANSDGVVLLSSDPDWRYRVLRPLTDAQRRAIEATRQFTGQPLDALAWRPSPNQRAEIGGEDLLHLITGDLPHGWQLHYFARDDRPRALSWLVTAAIAVALAGALIAYQILRTRRIGQALSRSVAEETALRQANERLAVEIEERRSAQQRLSRAQNELERASRLAALGQLSASVTHELGQPIAAMRNHLAAAEIGGSRSDTLTSQIGSLVDRMEGITRQLKFFARSDQEVFSDVALGAAMRVALGLLEVNLNAAGARVDVVFPEPDLHIRGSRLRVEQVMTNLLRNALDAVEDSERREIRIRFRSDEAMVWFELQDSGHGLGQTTLEELQEPFVTTRESGRGMGLGLAISSGIVRDHSGQMSARNTTGEGAIFRVEFPRNANEEVA